METKKKGKRARSFDVEIRSCSFCGSSSGIEISGGHRRNDAIFCQVCGAEYLLQSVNPVRLTLMEQYDVDDYIWDVGMDE